jgi:dTDP-4-dehydrorhamnose reductase
MRVLVLGDGMLGREIVKQTGWDYISRKKDDLNIVDDFEKVSYHVRFNYDVILNCIANTNTYSSDSKSMNEVNYKFVTNLVDVCNNYPNKKLVHISTDYVYANSIENATEDDAPSPDSNWYSVTKLLADEHIKAFSKDYLICRLSHKPYPFPYESAWEDVHTNADYTPIIADLVIKLVINEASGVYNVGTSNKTIYELASKSKTVKKTNSPNHIPKNVTMNISKLENFLVSLHYD